MTINEIPFGPLDYLSELNINNSLNINPMREREREERWERRDSHNLKRDAAESSSMINAKQVDKGPF